MNLTWIEARAAEPSTWAGLTALASAFGITVSPHNAGIITAAGLGLAGVIGVVAKNGASAAAIIPDVEAAVTDVVVPVIAATANTTATAKTATKA